MTSWIYCGLLSVSLLNPCQDDLVIPEVVVTDGQAVETQQEPNLSGYWCGSWRSCTNGHQGPLQAQICQLSPTCYRANFSGKFFKFVPFRYSVTLHVTKVEGDTVYLSGSSQLGPIMGTFRYNAVVSDGYLQARYSSKKDCGQWTLRQTCH